MYQSTFLPLQNEIQGHLEWCRSMPFVTPTSQVIGIIFEFIIIGSSGKKSWEETVTDSLYKKKIYSGPHKYSSKDNRKVKWARDRTVYSICRPESCSRYGIKKKIVEERIESSGNA